MRYLLFLALLALFIVTFGGFWIGFFAPAAPKPRYKDLNKIEQFVRKQL